MFDILGIVNLSPKRDALPLPCVFCSGPWKGHTALKRHTVNEIFFRAVCLRHAYGTNSYCVQNKKHLFIVGEVFPNETWTAKTEDHSRPTGKLSAHELLYSYQENNTNILRQIKGNFVLVFLDEQTGECCLFNSRFGISPFYYAMSNSQFIFSTSLAAIAKCLPIVPVIDKVAVAELALFNYPLGDRTYFRNVRMLRPAEIVHVNASGLKSEIYWDVRTLYDVSLYPRKDALEIGAKLFHKTVNQLACDVPKVRISFTSGFDSRALLSVLEKEPEDYLSYSFGIPESLNVTIPQQIARELSLSYQPVVLGKKYEGVFEDYAMQALLFSDCLSTVERANYPYAFEELAHFSPVVLTGLFGSELMRTFQNVGHIVSAGFARLNAAADPWIELRRVLGEPDITRYFAPELLRDAAEDIEADVDDMLVERFGEMSADRRFYMFLLTEGLRKYFGAEVHMERLYGANRFPFLDDDFVDFLFRAPFAGVYSRTLRPTVRNRHQSQYFYAYVIRKYRPELLDTPTDHGYPPSDVLLPFAPLIIGPKQLLARRWRRRNGYREFETEEWTEDLYKKKLFQKHVDTRYFTPALGSDFRNGEWVQNRLEFARAASLKLWLEMNQ